MKNAECRMQNAERGELRSAVEKLGIGEAGTTHYRQPVRLPRFRFHFGTGFR